MSDLSKRSVIHKIYENKKNNNIYSSKNLLGIILFGVLNVTQLAGWAKAQSIQVAVSAFPTSMDPHFNLNYAGRADETTLAAEIVPAN